MHNDEQTRIFPQSDDSGLDDATVVIGKEESLEAMRSKVREQDSMQKETAKIFLQEVFKTFSAGHDLDEVALRRLFIFCIGAKKFPPSELSFEILLTEAPVNTPEDIVMLFQSLVTNHRPPLQRRLIMENK